MTGLRLQKKLNYLRWLVLVTVFLMLLLIPFLYLYQTFVAAHAYDYLSSYEKLVYRFGEFVTSPFTSDPKEALDALKGTTWSGRLFGLALSDPLAVVANTAASRQLYWPFVVTALLPIALTLLLGRFFCGWICPATFIYELNDNMGAWLRKLGVPVSRRRLNRSLKYFVLVVGIAWSALFGVAVFSWIYPPLLVGRELNYAITLGGFGAGMVFFILTLLFDLLVARRGFCRYLCPGGALYSLLGHFRLLRIQRRVERCNDCAKCNAVCQFGLSPLTDRFTRECNNCTACIQVCPTDALSFEVRFQDQPYQGPGHLGRHYTRTETAAGQPPLVIDADPGRS